MSLHSKKIVNALGGFFLHIGILLMIFAIVYWQIKEGFHVLQTCNNEFKTYLSAFVFQLIGSLTKKDNNV